MSEPAQEPVLDTKLRLKHLHADPDMISCGGKSMALDEVEWVACWASRIAEKRFMFPTTYRNEWEFMIGRYPYTGGQRLHVFFSQGGRDAQDPTEWTFLVNLVRHELEPRLLNDIIARVGNGETVSVGGTVQLSAAGISCPKPKFSVPWAAVSSARAHNGMVWIYRDGVADPLVTIPMRYPNAGLIPTLVAGFTGPARHSRE